MTDREYRLRERIDALRDERDALLQRVEQLEARLRRKPKRCAYCGAPTGGRITCRAHRDLLRLDEVMA